MIISISTSAIYIVSIRAEKEWNFLNRVLKEFNDIKVFDKNPNIIIHSDPLTLYSLLVRLSNFTDIKIK